MIQVPEINLDLAENQFKSRFIHNESPALIKKGCADWLATQKWSLSYFEKIGESVVVPISRYKEKGHESPDVKEQSTLASLMREYQQAAASEEGNSTLDRYLAGWHYLEAIPYLFDDISVPSFFSDNLLQKVSDEVFHYDWSSIFIGPDKSETPSHTDSFYVAVWIALIKGQKRIRYVSSEFHHLMNSGIDLFEESVVKSLEANGATVLEALVEEGDIAYHPPGWWHQVVNRGSTIAVSNNYVSNCNFLTFEQQLLSKTALPIFLKLFELSKVATEIGPENAHTLVSNQTLKTSNYLKNQYSILGFLKSYVSRYERICNTLDRTS